MKKSILVCVILVLGTSGHAACPRADVTGDCYVGLADLAVMASQWLTGPEIPDDMVVVPAGSFAYQTEYYVFVDDFAIDKYEVTVAAYCEFLNYADPDGNHWDGGQEIVRTGDPGNYSYEVQAGRENYPVRYVSFYDAEIYAAWKSAITGKNYRLGTEEEWEKAAGWDPVVKKLWTYGFQQDSVDSTWCNYDDAYGGPLPVGSFDGTDGKNDAKSFYGCYDMSGNVYEWTSSIYSGSSRVLRGGDWYGSALYCRVAHRLNYSPSNRIGTLGFRLLLDL
ncbi:MAG: SUMF1/EgtB/PvdO family nonheme iron enzyme [Sedimenticolaceae bacterium]